MRFWLVGVCVMELTACNRFLSEGERRHDWEGIARGYAGARRGRMSGNHPVDPDPTLARQYFEKCVAETPGFRLQCAAWIASDTRVKADPAERLHYAEIACNTPIDGDLRALAQPERDPYLVKVDWSQMSPDESQQLLARAWHKEGEAVGCLILAQAFLSGKGRPKEVAKAIVGYSVACHTSDSDEKDDPEQQREPGLRDAHLRACDLLAEVYEVGPPGLRKPEVAKSIRARTVEARAELATSRADWTQSMNELQREHEERTAETDREYNAQLATVVQQGMSELQRALVPPGTSSAPTGSSSDAGEKSPCPCGGLVNTMQGTCKQGPQEPSCYKASSKMHACLRDHSQECGTDHAKEDAEVRRMDDAAAEIQRR